MASTSFDGGADAAGGGDVLTTAVLVGGGVEVAAGFGVAVDAEVGVPAVAAAAGRAGAAVDAGVGDSAAESGGGAGGGGAVTAAASGAVASAGGAGGAGRMVTQMPAPTATSAIATATPANIHEVVDAAGAVPAACGGGFGVVAAANPPAVGDGAGETSGWLTLVAEPGCALATPEAVSTTVCAVAGSIPDPDDEPAATRRVPESRFRRCRSARRSAAVW